MKLAEIHIETDPSGLTATHNMPCAICGHEKAVYSALVVRPGVACSVFEPCWTCQGRGWRLCAGSLGFHRRLLTVGFLLGGAAGILLTLLVALAVQAST